MVSVTPQLILKGVPIPEKITDGVSGVIQYLQNPRPDLFYDLDWSVSHRQYMCACLTSSSFLSLTIPLVSLAM